MTTLIGAAAVLSFIYIAFSVLFGRITPREAGSRIFGIVAFVVFAPVLLSAIFNSIRATLAPLLFGFVFGVFLIAAIAAAIFLFAAFLVRFTR